MLLRATPILLLVLAGAGMSVAGCSNGTTPVCDDAGSCLIVPPGDGGAPDTGGGDNGDGGDDGPGE